MTSAGRLCSVRVASAADIRSQVCDSDHFELIHDFQAVELVLSLPDTTPLQEVRRLAAERLGAPPQGLRFWRWTERENGTYRPFVPVEDDVVLSALTRQGPGPLAVDLFLECAAQGAALAAYDPHTDVLLFVKAFRGSTVPQPIEYMGHAVLQSALSLRAQLPELRRVAGMAGRGEVYVWEEVHSSPPWLHPLDLSKTPGQVCLLTGDILLLADAGEYRDARARLVSPDQQGPAGQATGQQAQAAGQEQQSQPRAQPINSDLAASAQQQPQAVSTEPSATERVALLLQQAAQEAERAALDRARLQQQLEEATAKAEQAAQQATQLQEQLAAKEIQVQQLSQQQRQHMADEQASNSGAQAATPRQQQLLQALDGDDAACRALSVAELQALHDRLEGGIARLRCLLLDRRVAEAQAEAQARVTQCSVCISAAKDTRLSPCGHLLCRQCSLRVAACPVCRQAVVGRQRAFL